eukprot:10582149-Lingulodinium_polyedra.AAC.1
MSNAFGSTGWSRLREVCETSLVEEEDISFAKQRFEQAAVLMPCGGEEELLLKTGCGALMGDPFAVHSFRHAFAQPVAQWNAAHYHFMGNDARALFCTAPWPGGGRVDLSISKFADDLVKLVLGNCEGVKLLAERIQQSSDCLDKVLEPFGYAQNVDKLACVCSVAGSGSRADLRKLRKGEPSIPGKAVGATRSLGSVVSHVCTFKAELPKRRAA